MDSAGNVYVADTWNDRIQKFTADGQYLTQWGSYGSGPEQFNLPRAVAVDSAGNVYVADSRNSRIQKFTADGQYLTQWGSEGSGPGEFDSPEGIAVDSAGNVYVADTWNDRIQKFTADGQYLTQWGSRGSGPGEFTWPLAVAVDSAGDVYVADTYNDRIQKFTADGQYLTQWDSYGSGPGEFDSPYGIAVDSAGNVYVADTVNYRIQKFTADGQYLTQWGSYGSGPGQFELPEGVAVDNAGNVYVADTLNSRIQRFNSEGDFLVQWGSRGSGPGEFIGAEGVAVDSAGNVYVADTINHRIQKFTADGQYLTQWGSLGSAPGQFVLPKDIAVDNAGTLYIADTINNRIQKFRPVPFVDNSKAIVVAGGGPFPGNNLWDATQMCANFAYRTLTYQGFTKEDIYYLTSDLDLDLDNNGEPDDVDGDVTSANLEHAITTWAADADSLVVYLTDHGGGDTFRMSGTETLSSSELDSWLDVLQETMPRRVVVIYDACDSGSFSSTLTPPAGKDRIVITSTSPGESAYFVSQGTISFSNFFWTHVFNGLDIAEAFRFASDAITQAIGTQHPQVDANGNGQAGEAEDLTMMEGVFIGNGTDLHEDRPVIGSVSEAQTVEDTNSATLSAFNVTDADGIMRVWAVIWPPEYQQGSSDSPVLQLPTIDLWPAEESGNWDGVYEGFSMAGTYQIAIYAKDRIGNTSLPSLTTVSVNNPLSRKAVIVVGGSSSDPLRPLVENCGGFAYEALTFQGYTDDDIYFMSPVGIQGVDVWPTLSNIEYALTDWAQEGTYDVVLYLVGDGNLGTFSVNETETLAASDLDAWLDELQEHISGTVTVVYDACRSASFLSALTPPAGKERIVISSAAEDEAAHFIARGAISFSAYFWRALLDGTNVRDAFLYAKVAIESTGRGQTAQLDDNGNGVGNEKTDGQLARNSGIGAGIMLAGDDPLIGSICPAQTLYGENTSATIWVEDVTTTGTIDSVWAVVAISGYSTGDASVPVTELPTLELDHVGGGRYEGTYVDFSALGRYDVAVYAKDEEGNVSVPSTTTVTHAMLGDVNTDNEANAVDVQLVINEALSIPTSYDCDLNLDGLVNALDVQFVINAALGVEN